MKVQDALEILGLLASEQHGLVTTRQAEDSGVTRLYVQRLEADGVLTRMRTGVYALPSSAPGILRDVYATWLFLTATRNNAQSQDLVVVSGQTAAQLHDIGQFAPDHYEFTVPKPRRTRQEDIRFKVRTVGAEDITYFDSMPVLTITATLEQLAKDGVDGDHLQQASEVAASSKMTTAELASAYERAMQLDPERMRVMQRALVAGLQPQLDQFRKMAIDSQPLRDAIAAIEVVKSMGDSVARTLNSAEIARSLEPTMVISKQLADYMKGAPSLIKSDPGLEHLIESTREHIERLGLRDISGQANERNNGDEETTDEVES